MTDKLTISDLADVLAALKEVVRPYQLGIQLKIDSSELDKVENNHPREIDRQKTEVVKYWLRNSPDASWTTLANAVERMGGHAKLVDNLRGHPEEDESLSRTTSKYLLYKPHPVAVNFDFTESVTVAEPVYVSRSILILGKREHGKSTLGNRLLNFERYFGTNNQSSQTRSGSAILNSVSMKKTYKIDVYDHNGLLEGFSSIDTLSSKIPRELHLVIVVLKYGLNIDGNEQKILKRVMNKWQINQISALVLTHCENLSERDEKEYVEQFIHR